MKILVDERRGLFLRWVSYVQNTHEWYSTVIGHVSCLVKRCEKSWYSVMMGPKCKSACERNPAPSRSARQTALWCCGRISCSRYRREQISEDVPVCLMLSFNFFSGKLWRNLIQRNKLASDLMEPRNLEKFCSNHNLNYLKYWLYRALFRLFVRSTKVNVAQTTSIKGTYTKSCVVTSARALPGTNIGRVVRDPGHLSCGWHDTGDWRNGCVDLRCRGAAVGSSEDGDRICDDCVGLLASVIQVPQQRK